MYMFKRYLKNRLLSITITMLTSCVTLMCLNTIKSHADYYSYADDYGLFLQALGERESSNRYILQNRYGYMGRWQLGTSALQDLGFLDNNNNFTPLANSFGVFDKTTFLLSAQAQDYAVYQYHRQTWNYLVNHELDKYVGTVVQLTQPMPVEHITINEDGEEEVTTVIEDVVVEEINVTISNLIAGSHLMGVGSMQKYLEGDTTLKDANGTEINEYMRLFGNYNITDTIVYGVPFQEICNCTNMYTGQYVVQSADLNKDGITVYSGHGIYNYILGTIYNGQTIYITKSDGVWAHIQLQDGSEGYIMLSDLKTFQHVSKIGDINNDGIVDFLDILQIQKYVLANENPYILSSVDFNGNGRIDITDILNLKKQAYTSTAYAQ